LASQALSSLLVVPVGVGVAVVVAVTVGVGVAKADGDTVELALPFKVKLVGLTFDPLYEILKPILQKQSNSSYFFSSKTALPSLIYL
jgi:hypothetical protein